MTNLNRSIAIIMEYQMKTRNTILLALLGLVLLFGVNYMLFTGMLQGLPPAVEEALESDSSI